MNIHIFSDILNFLEVWAAHGGYILLFVISILEALPLIGSTVPGQTIVILSGLLARSGTFDLWLVLLIASSGAVIGDTVGFYLGKKYGIRIIEKYKSFFFFKDEYIEKARALIGNHTGKALILGRFNPVTRPFMPFLVGASHSRAGRFWFFNALSGVLWATSSALLGYAFGIGFDSVASYFGKAFLIATIFAAVVIWGYHIVNRQIHIFKKYELISLILAVLSLWALAETIQDAWAPHSFMANFDVWVSSWMTTHAAPFWIGTAGAISTVFQPEVFFGAGIVLAVFLFFQKQIQYSIMMLLSVTAASNAVLFLKDFFMRARPGEVLNSINLDPSFPSGHACLAAAFLTIIAYFAANHIKSLTWRELSIAGCVFAVILIGVSRLIVNAHWFSDVIAGWSLGILCASASILLVRYAGFLLSAGRRYFLNHKRSSFDLS